MRQGAYSGTRGTGSVQATDIMVIECGRIAHRVLAAERQGVVSALFRRSCYLEFAGRRTICLGDGALGRGPLNARVERFVAPRLGEALALSADGATLWQPPTRRGPPQRSALDALRTAAVERIPSDGLGALVCGSSNALIEHARPGLAALERWLAGGRLGGEARMLLGLGPGLTPSGDDYFGGLLIGLRAFGRPADADALWAWLGPRSVARTSLISAAHLAAAAEGEAHESLHACLDALVDGTITGWPRRLDWLGSVGHCSGWDGLAGVLAVAERVAH